MKKNYILRGWDKMAWVLVHRPENSYRRLSQEEFQVLLLCDGKIDLNNVILPEKMKKVLSDLYMEDIIEVCESERSLEDEQYYRYYDNRFIQSVFWSVTGRCNFRCRHCYMDAPQGILGELSHEEAINLIDQMEECGVLRIDITGGEPLIRKDFWILIDRIRSKGMAIGQIYTNGWMLTNEILQEFERRDLKPEFSISFDGVGWHDWMRGINGAEKAALNALKLCSRQGYFTSVEMCIHKSNRETVRDTVNLLSDIGVSKIKIGNVLATDLWKNNNEGNSLNIREYTDSLIEYIPHFFEDGMPMEVVLGGVISLYKNSKEYKIVPLKYKGIKECGNRLLCGTARYSCYITPEGRLVPCLPMTACKEQKKFPLIQNIGLRQGLSNSFYMDIVDSRVKDLLEANSECAACKYKYQCGGGCRAAALDQTGDLMGCDSDQCILWKEGYVDRIRQVTEDAIAKYCTDDEGIS